MSPPMPDLPEPQSARRDSREFFRVRYPLKERPLFHAPDLVASVADFSETGMTLVGAAGANANVRPGDRVTGVIQFRHSPRPTVDGVVQRLTENGFVVRFDEARVPWAAVPSEERAILKRHAC